MGHIVKRAAGLRKPLVTGPAACDRLSFSHQRLAEYASPPVPAAPRKVFARLAGRWIPAVKPILRDFGQLVRRVAQSLQNCFRENLLKLAKISETDFNFHG